MPMVCLISKFVLEAMKVSGRASIDIVPRARELNGMER